MVLSLTTGFAVCEATLRIVHPRYQLLAAPPVFPQGRHAAQLRARDATLYSRPDTGDIHVLRYNTLGNRQHREFTERDLLDSVNVAFFGDSFTENRYVAVQYSFTEALDYLLNANAAHQARRINVLNFGVAGTGPTQQYARYTAFPAKERLRHVFYVHWRNDFDDLRANAPHGAGWKRWVAGFHVTYLALDAWRHAFPRSGPGRVDDPTAQAFREVVLNWQADVEASGGSFHVVLLPGSAEFASMAWPASLDVLDLGPYFQETFGNSAPWLFENDIHWNEAGNMVAAHRLYRFLEGKLGLRAVPDDALAEARHLYYQAFAEDDQWPGYRWLPSPPWALPGPLTAEHAAAIRGRYLKAGFHPRQRVIEHVRDNEPHVRAEGWEVYAVTDEERKEFVYVKTGCGDEPPTSRLFLRVFALSHAAAPSGRDVLLEAWLGKADQALIWREGDRCMVMRGLHHWPLPDERIAGEGATGVQLGEQDGPGGSVRWQSTIAFESAQTVAAKTAPYRAKYMAMADREPDARSHWDVHVSETEVVYLKDPCHAADLNGPFFLRVVPTTFTRRHFRRRAFFRQFHAAAGGDSSAMFDGKCIMTLRLPELDLPESPESPEARVATVSTSQGRIGAVLWHATVHLDADRFRNAYDAATAGRLEGRAVFDVYRVDNDLVYIREDCEAADVQARFFLHFLPTLPAQSPLSDFVINFAFPLQGIRAEGRCVAVMPLPDDRSARIRTGQVGGDKELWAVEL